MILLGPGVIVAEMEKGKTVNTNSNILNSENNNQNSYIRQKSSNFFETGKYANSYLPCQQISGQSTDS